MLRWCWLWSVFFIAIPFLTEKTVYRRSAWILDAKKNWDGNETTASRPRTIQLNEKWRTRKKLYAHESTAGSRLGATRVLLTFCILAKCLIPTELTFDRLNRRGTIAGDKHKCMWKARKAVDVWYTFYDFRNWYLRRGQNDQMTPQLALNHTTGEMCARFSVREKSFACHCTSSRKSIRKKWQFAWPLSHMVDVEMQQR